MKRVGIFTSASILCLTFTACTLGYAQEPQDKHQGQQQEKGKQNKGQEKKQQDQGKRNQGQQQHQQDQYKQDTGQQKKEQNQYGHEQQYKGDNGNHYGRQKQIERSEQQVHEQQAVQRRAWQERRANHWEYEHRSWQQRGGYNGYRVPDDYFREYYGHNHYFRVYSLPFIYQGGNPRFQYGGYWFTMMDPYPESWGGNWYERDDVYVDYYNDGYYLFNRRYPGRPGIALSITF
jgi:hypothetical protein